MARKTPRLAAGRARALGVPTRGTTSPNRLRRNDNWITSSPLVAPALAGTPLVVDLGYGASAITAIELFDRLREKGWAASVLGMEIDPARVEAALPFARDGLEFAVGGFEFAGQQPNLVRAMNVLRQYPESDAAAAWRTMCAGLAPGGLLIEGTCNEIGRIGAWVLLDAAGPRSLTFVCAPEHLDTPATFAERLPKSLIHHNVPGMAIHELLRDFTAAWATAAPVAVFGPVQRFAAACESLAERWPVLDGRTAHRRGYLTVDWACVAPTG